MVDWSAAARPRPPKPSPDACWIALGYHGAPTRAPPEYFRTRDACLARLRRVLIDHPGPALVGVDFSLGYPLGPRGQPLLPVGRALARLMARMIHDAPDGQNDRFAVAADLNRRLRRDLRDADGPFWGCPPRAASNDLRPTKRPTRAPEWRQVEVALRGHGHRPHSVWKLYTTGSVGSQTLLGLAALGRWLDDPDLAPRLQLWPFDAGFRTPRGRRTIVVGEVWPSLLALPAVAPGGSTIRDARQVAALRDAAVTQADAWSPVRRPRGLSAAMVKAARSEGWILGLPNPIKP